LTFCDFCLAAENAEFCLNHLALLPLHSGFINWEDVHFHLSAMLQCRLTFLQYYAK
jgi:hypothetical protein